MAEEGPRSPRIRLPRVSLPTRSRRGGGSQEDSATTETKPQEAAKPASKPTEPASERTESKPQEAPKPPSKPNEAASKPTDSKPQEAAKPAGAGDGTQAGATKGPTPPVVATKTGTGSPPEPTLQERIEGLQGWMAEIERKQGRLTYFGALGLLIAIAAAGAALYFGLTNRSDSAKKSDVDALTKRLDSLEGAVTKNSKDTQNALNASIAQLQQSISGLQKHQTQSQATISSLQSQVAAASAAKGAAPAAGAKTGTTTTTTPGAPKKP